MQILIVIAAAWYLGRALVGAGRHGNVHQAVLSLGLGLVWLPLLHFLPTSFGFDYLLFGGIALAGIAYDLRYRRPWSLIEGDFEALFPERPVEWLCAVVAALSLLLMLLLLAGPMVIPGSLGPSTQAIHELGQLGKGDFPGTMGVGLGPLVAGLYHLGGLYGARILFWFWALVLVAAAAMLGHRLAGRRGAFVAAALCAVGPWISSFGLAFPEHGWHVLAVLLFASALLPEGGAAPSFRLVAVAAAPVALAATDMAGAPMALAALLLAPVSILASGAPYPAWLKGAVVFSAGLLALLLAVLYYGVERSVHEAGYALWSQMMRPPDIGAWLLNPGAAALAFGLPALVLGGRPGLVASAGLGGFLLGAWVGAAPSALLAPLMLLLVAGAAWVSSVRRGSRMACGIAALLALGGLAYPVAWNEDRMALLLGRETPTAYLERHVPRMGAVSYCNTQHPDEAVALFEPMAMYLGAYGFVVTESMILEEAWPRNLLERPPLLRPRVMVLPSREVLATKSTFSDPAIERLESLRRGETPGFPLLRRLDLPRPDGSIDRVWLLRVAPS